MNLIVRRKHTKKNTSACLCSILKKGTIYTSTEGASLPVKPLWQTAVKKILITQRADFSLLHGF